MKQGDHFCSHAVRHVPADEGSDGVSPASVKRGSVSAQGWLRMQAMALRVIVRWKNFLMIQEKADFID